MNNGYTYENQIDGDAEGETVLAYYATRYRHSTESEWRERVERGAVQLDGRVVATDAVLRAGQRLTYRRAPWAEPEAPSGFGTIYEDAEVLVVDKPSGLPVLPGGGHLENTLLAQVRRRYGGDIAPSPLHRLGRGTSGIVLFARTKRALQRLTCAFVARRITKVYRALVQGVGLPAEQTIDVPIGRVAYPPIGQLHAALREGVPATSVCRLLHEDHERSRSLVEVRIVTGRTHQIRIHMAAIGHPLVGDPLYVVGGGPAPLIPGARAPLPGDCGYHLHAWRLVFSHPATGAEMDLASPPPLALLTPGESASLD